MSEKDEARNRLLSKMEIPGWIHDHKRVYPIVEQKTRQGEQKKRLY